MIPDTNRGETPQTVALFIVSFPDVVTTFLKLLLPGQPAIVLLSQASAITDLISAYCPRSLMTGRGKLSPLFMDALLSVLRLQPPLSQKLQRLP